MLSSVYFSPLKRGKMQTNAPICLGHTYILTTFANIFSKTII